MSGNKIKVQLQVAPENVLLARRNLQKGGKAQQYVDSEVTRCCDKYVPLDKGYLKESHSPATVVGSGRVVYGASYARRNYYENRGRGTEGTAKGGLRGRLWFERMKPDHLPGILKGVKKIAGSK